MNGLMEKSLLEIEREPLNRQDVEQQIGELRVLEDDEKQIVPPTPTAPEHEHTVPIRKKLVALLGYFLCNVGLTLYNKAVLGKFHSPWLLTATHAGTSFIGCLILLWLGHFRMTKLTLRENLALFAFSLLFTANIAVSNVSLAMVSVAFHQVVRGTTPFFTTLLYRWLFWRTFSTQTYLALLPVVFGVMIATYGDYTYTPSGFAMTLLGVMLAALKTIVTNKMMTGRLALGVWEILLRMSPLACAQSLVFASFNGELAGLFKYIQHEILAAETPSMQLTTKSPIFLAIILVGNGALAFLLNVSSFTTNKLAGALTMTVCANIKQCLTILLGITLFDATVNSTTLLGIVITLSGGAMYSFVELDSKRRKLNQQTVGGGK